MAELLKLISDWKRTCLSENALVEYQSLFRDKLRQHPYYLRYALDKQRDDLLMIYQTDRSDKNNDIVKECNGIILDKTDFSIVAYGMRGRVDETENFYSGNLPINIHEYDLEEVDDGAVLTVYNYGGEWLVATKRSIDASRVRWSSSRNFLELLSDALSNPLETFARDLDPGYTYSFVLLHPENHLVLLHQKPELIYVSRRNNETLEEENISSLSNESVGNEPIFPWAQQRTRLTAKECLSRLSQEKKMEKRGIMCVSRNDPLRMDRIKIDYKWFHEADKLRKGLPSLHLSYLACSPDEKQRMRSYFGNLMEFRVIDDLLRNLIHYVYSVYRESYVKKQYRVPQQHPICKTLRILHYDYRMTGEPVRVHHVAALIDRTPCQILDSMLKFFSTYGFNPPLQQAYSAPPRSENGFPSATPPSVAPPRSENGFPAPPENGFPSAPTMEQISAGIEIGTIENPLKYLRIDDA